MSFDNSRTGLDFWALIGFALFFRVCFYFVLKIRLNLLKNILLNFYFKNNKLNKKRVYLKSDKVLLS